MHELLSPKQMAMADKLTIESGISGITLMENAGQAVVDVLDLRFPKAHNILIVCGAGNNGGDGFIAARRLADAGKDVAVFICGDIAKISGDAELALAKLDKSILVDRFPDLQQFDLIIDAIFGAGLDREVKGETANIIGEINQSNKPIIAVDLPSGIDGRTGQIMGCAVKADQTVTFFRMKPGHLLLPGRVNCGERHLRQIGICETVLKKAGVTCFQNAPAKWQDHYPIPSFEGHKYSRGHTLVFSGPLTATGAARLVAQAALRTGSGLVTLASPKDAVSVNAAHLTSVMLLQADTPKNLQKILKDQRLNCVALGPGLPPDKKTAEAVIQVLEMGRRTILDAGALAAFSRQPQKLFDAIKACEADVFLTPHDGEFLKLFPTHASQQSKIDKAQAAANTSGATIILKGADTVVATPQGEISVSDNAPPWLATAGSGDVLAGVLAGLAAQGMPAFEAACAAVWLHGDAANRLGPGIISSDLDEGLRQSLNHLISAQFNHTS